VNEFENRLVTIPGCTEPLTDRLEPDDSLLNLAGVTGDRARGGLGRLS
jgi:hypothetical protein